MSLLTPPIYEANGVRAPDVRTLLACGAAPRLLDRQGVAALLWRGAAMGARLPVVDVRRIAGPGPATEGEPADPRRTTLEEFRGALARAEGEGDAPLPEANVAGFDRWRVEIMDMPAARGVVPTRPGVDALFGRGGLFRRFAAAGWRLKSRPRPGGDPLDVANQRDREIEAFVAVEAQRLHALTALLPAATRAAITTTGPRPPDGLNPGTSGLGLASDLLRRGAQVDRDLVALELHARASGLPLRVPVLDSEVVAAARGLDPRVRFGSPGSGGPYSVLERRVPDPIEAAARGPLLPFIEATLTRERIAAQGILVPDAVLEAIARFRRDQSGWTGEAILLLALLTDWVERNGLVLDSRA